MREVGVNTRIIYAGRVTEKNCGNLIEQDGVGGFLVGRDSIKPQFREIVESLMKVQK